MNLCHHAPRFRHVYVACFCDEKDELNQWREYGSGSGYALGFSFRECQPRDLNAGKNKLNIRLDEVIYRPDEQIKTLDSIWGILAESLRLVREEERIDSRDFDTGFKFAAYTFP